MWMSQIWIYFRDKYFIDTLNWDSEKRMAKYALIMMKNINFDIVTQFHASFLTLLNFFTMSIIVSFWILVDEKMQVQRKISS